MSERVVAFGPERGLMGIFTEPAGAGADQPTAILFNAGFLPRMGPNRLHVQLARRLAALGFPVLRFDFAGIGDSLPSRSREPAERRFAAEAREAIDFATRELGARGAVPIGLCTGANLAHRLALDEDRVVGAVLINGGLVEPDDEAYREAQARLDARYYRRQLKSPAQWLRVLRGKSNLRAIVRTAGRVLGPKADAPPSAESRGESPSGPELGGGELQRLRERGVPLLAIYSDGSIAWDLVCMAYGPAARDIRDFEGIELAFVENCDHVFTPRWTQAEVLSTICDWFSRGTWSSRREA